MTGVYKITNIINNKCYIGSSIDIEARWERHKYLMNTKGRHYDYYLYRAMRKYGIENFEFIVLERCNESVLIERETYYFYLYNPEYNLIVPNENPAKNKEVQERISRSAKKAWVTRSEESKQATLNNLKIGHVSTGSGKFPPKKITAIEIKSGNTINFDSMYEAEKTLKIHRSSISQILNKNHPRKSSKGYTFKHYCE